MPPILRRAARPALFVLLGVAFVLGTAWLDGGRDIVPTMLWRHPEWLPWWSVPLRMVCNALPGLLLAGAVVLVSRRAGSACALAFVLQAPVFAVNALKESNLAVPLVPADVRMLGQLRHGGLDLLSGYLPHVLVAGLVVLLVLAVLIAGFRCEPPCCARGGWRWRLPAGAGVALLLVSLLAGMPVWRALYEPQLLGMQPWSAIATRRHNGVIGSLLLYNVQFAGRRQQADVQAALALLARHAESPAPTRTPGVAATAHAPPPDIVVVLSESFFDPTQLRGYAPGTDFTPNLTRLRRHGVSGALHVPTFGGGTIRTEFELLTGLSLRYFPDITFPYLQIRQPRIPGLVRHLRALGYTALAVHGNNPAFWNRDDAFKALGFERFISLADFPASDRAKDGLYLSDRAFTDELLRQLPGNGPPRFVLGISMEAHGPYGKLQAVEAAARDAIIVPAAITDATAQLELRNYIYHLRHADQQLGRLVASLAARPRRTLILFFGDHLPALVPAFQQAGFKNGQGFLLQTVPYVLIDTAHMQPARRHDAASWELPGMVLAQAGLGGDRWFALTQTLAPALAALTRAPDAPPPPTSAAQRQLEVGLRSVSALRLQGELEVLWPQAAALAAEPPVIDAAHGARRPRAEHPGAHP